MMNEIDIREIKRLRIGHAQDMEAMTGVTALLFEGGALAGVDIRGGGPASRETPVLSPTTAQTPVHALLLAGGSAYGLAAATGAMSYLEARHIGYDTGFALVPIVVQSCIYDLSYGSSTIRPDADMGYRACSDAMEHNQPRCGIIGAGTGATVGKICGMQRASKSGIGIFAAQIGQLQIGAVVVVNAIGDIYSHDGKRISGLMNIGRTDFADSTEELYKISQPADLLAHQNTTIGAILTNGKFDETALTKIAQMTGAAYARCIRPVNTMSDGDSIYAVSLGDVQADINMTGTMAADVMAMAIERAILASDIDDKEYLAKCVKISK
jgi:L-aminopeptidase/D-esterase-like protein